jgi:glycosyltransferase involved in cell wall biosynthesis
MSDLVSIIVTTKNEVRHLDNCLRSIEGQTYPNIELIVIDNNSTDHTKTIALGYTSQVFNQGPERSAQRNLGMMVVARGTYVVYFDADMILTPNLIENCVKQMKSDNIEALYIPEQILGRSLFSTVRRFERQFYNATSIDAARFFKRKSFIQSGGFDEALFKFGSGEDWDLDKKIRLKGKIELLNVRKPSKSYDNWVYEFSELHGVSISRSWEGVLHNESDVTLVSYVKKKRYYAGGFVGYINKWGRFDPDIRNQFGLYYRFFKVFFEKGKWRIVTRHPFLFLLTIALKAIVGIFTYRIWNE